MGFMRKPRPRLYNLAILTASGVKAKLLLINLFISASYKNIQSVQEEKLAAWRD
jgi:hypothetical protein